ncbi:MAG: hypothetical protein KH828_07840 [Clostridiales bacterium]|nr:hypothetical protein [Clostridiales bacterium]
MKYRKKPIVVEAFKLTTDVETIAPDWFIQAVVDEKVWIDRSMVDGHISVYGCTIQTLEGKLHAKIGDYIIRGLRGELYPCKTDIFQKTYERVT